MKKENWNRIKESSSYLISDKGRIKSLSRSVYCRGEGSRWHTGKILKPYINCKGYYTIRIHQKSFRLSRLVAINFIPNPENKTQVNHIDGNKLNNCVENLEWNTPSENIKHSFKMGLSKHQRGENHSHRLTWEEVKYIRKSTFSQSKLGSIFGVHKSTIKNIKSYRTWKIY